jgi:O-antigen ligase/tetratricopeptide (TPR) repeat protein
MSPAADVSRSLEPAERILLLGAMLVAVAAPLAIGGALPVTQVVLSAAALALLVAYVLVRGTRGLRPLPFAAAAGVALAFTALQIVPLPAPLVALLSPHAYELRLDAASAARWMPLSVDVPSTLLACARGTGCLALLLVVGGIVGSRRSATRMLTVIAATSVALALVALAQRLAGTTAILGFYRPRSMPGFGVFGTFVDVNHAASILALGALVAAGLAAAASGRARIVLIAFAVVSTAALLFTASRGALLGFAIGGFLLTAALMARSVGVMRGLVGAGVLLLVGVAVTLWTSEGLRQRFSEQPQQLADNQKTRGWRDGLSMAAEYPWTGVGRGAFEAPATKYRRRDEGIRLVYPENIIVQMVSEWGFPMTLVLIGMVLTTAVRLAPAVARGAPPLAGAACGVVAVIVHELTDFGTELPGVAFPTIVVLAIVAGRISAERRRSTRRSHRVPLRASLPGAAVAALTIVGAAWASGHTLDEDFTRLHASIQSRGVDQRELQVAIERHPADDYFELLAAQEALKAARPDAAMHHINHALRLHPGNWQAHRMAAVLLMSLKRPAQAALEYRLALDTGMGFDPGELYRNLGHHVVDAVPQTPAMLLELARAIGNAEEADAIAQRAVEVADSRSRALLDRAELALASKAPVVSGRAARALLAEADSVEAFAVAARGLAQAGAQAESNAAISAGMKQFPRDGSLYLVGAELRLASGDLAGAYAMLVDAGKQTLSLAERQRVEDLVAEWADRTGDREIATMARARSRLIGRQIRDITQPGKAN